MKFNINNYVRVRLTDYGKRMLMEQFLEGKRKHPEVFREFNLPKEDKDGWSTWQMWNLISTFGNYIRLGGEPPFHTEIEIIH